VTCETGEKLDGTDACVAEEGDALGLEIAAVVPGAGVAVVARLVQLGGELEALAIFQHWHGQFAGDLLLFVFVVGLAGVDGKS